MFKRIRFNYLPIARNLTNVLISNADAVVTISDNTSGSSGYDQASNSTGSFGIAKGNSAQRDNIAYGFRFNTERKTLEFYKDNVWSTIFYTEV